jgi:hypothetical protein
MAINKEPVYDDKIAPLMTEIIKICKDNDIPMVASFQLTDGPQSDEEAEEYGDDCTLCCTTVLLPKWSDKKLKMARMVLRDGWEAVSPIQAFTITTRSA